MRYKITNISQGVEGKRRNIYLSECSQKLEPTQWGLANRIEPGTRQLEEQGLLEITEGEFDRKIEAPAVVSAPANPINYKEVSVGSDGVTAKAGGVPVKKTVEESLSGPAPSEGGATIETVSADGAGPAAVTSDIKAKTVTPSTRLPGVSEKKPKAPRPTK